MNVLLVPWSSNSPCFLSRGGDLDPALGGGVAWLVGYTLMAHSAPQYKSDRSLKFHAISKATVFGGGGRGQRVVADGPIKQGGVTQAQGREVRVKGAHA